jgi:pilus assembly protein CpaB
MVIAAVLAAVAAFSTYAFLRSTEQRAFGDARLVEVFVVAKDIPKGMFGEQAIDGEFIEKRNVPSTVRPTTATTDLAELRGKVALTDLSANTPIVGGLFVDPRSAQVTFSQRIPAGQVAITVSVDQVRGVAGLLVPGDRVNILVSEGATQRYLFQNVEIIAIGTTAAPEAGETQPVTNPGSGLITFAVPPAAAPKIAFASQQSGGLYLSLVPPDYQPIDLPAVDANNLFSGGLTPS